MTSKNKKISLIIFYAPIGTHTKGHKNGGAEAGCKKTLSLLNKAGYVTLLIEKPVRSINTTWGGILFIFRLTFVWLKLLKILIRNQGQVFHIAGFYLKQIYFEWLLAKCATLLKIKVVYEIRNGGMIEAYYNRGIIYRWFMKSTLLSSTVILSQGYDYVRFLKENFNKFSFYYPNYIMNEFIKKNNTSRKLESEIHLVYLGRVVKEKNIEFILEVCKELKASNTLFSLDIVGGYEESYYNVLATKIKKNDLSESNIRFHGRLQMEQIASILMSSHFFIFPSKESREGHSNALTEAMSYGVVPIVSKVGFNDYVVDNDELVMSDFDSKLYCETILNVWNSGDWEILSSQVYTRVINNYTESIIKDTLLHAYNQL